MQISSIRLIQFRNFHKATYELSPHITLIIGENARGKTSLLEGIYVAIYGHGFRESREHELLKFGSDDCIVEAVCGEDRGLYQIRILKTGEETVKKSYHVNKSVKTTGSYRKLHTHAVLFAPEQIEIITGSPSKRREYFDQLLGSLDLEYKKRLKNYEGALRRRNKILEHHVSEEQMWEEIKFWNDYMYEESAYIVKKRKEYVDYLNQNPHVDGKEFEIYYHSSPFSPEEIKRVYDLEMRIRRTAVGPQKDDFVISLKKKNELHDIQRFGSRSEQRMAIFWLKLNELKYLEKQTKKRPILLLDDVFSELDSKNRELVIKVITNYQTIATTTEEEIRDLVNTPEVVIRL